MKKPSLIRNSGILCVFLLMLTCVFTPMGADAQSTASLHGTVTDPLGAALPNSQVIVTPEGGGAARKVTSDAQGRYNLSGLAPGRYTVQVTEKGFSSMSRSGVELAAGQSQELAVSLHVASVSEQVVVEATDSNSVAAEHAPMGALLSATSARTEISNYYIQNFTAPTADYGELTQMVPGTFTTSENGVGLGQSNTNFRGFSDGYYDIDFDGLPFYDTNTPTHHSWAFFRSQWIGGVDFDRSPGTASTIGPTPFGGSIHLLSKDLTPMANVQGGVSYGSFNTQLYNVAFDSGSFGGVSKSQNAFVDIHHMSSDGYETDNKQLRNAGSVKYQYQISSRTVLTGFAGVVWLDSNTPNLSSSRQTLQNNGDNYLLQHTDATQATYRDYNYYHVPTDFEYVGIVSELGKGWRVNFKPYTYNYDNSEFYAKQPKSGDINTANCAPVPTKVTESGVTQTIPISPCAVDKYNSYRKYGELAAFTQTSSVGVFRGGLWFEHALTNRHQVPSNPFTKADDALPNFSESFTTNSYQPYGEYEFHVTSKLNVTAGVKLAYYQLSFTQMADNGGKIGNINPVTQQPFTSVTNAVNYHSVLPSLDANYRIRSNWSVYGQGATGSVVPPTSVYDVSGGLVAVPPKPQKSTTYQAGTVLKLNRVALDVDYYHIRFQNGYSSSTDTNPNDAQYGESINYISPSSITKGMEAEATIYLGGGLTAYVNGSAGKATYVGTLTVYSPSSSTSNPLVVQAPAGLWVAETPDNTESFGMTYQNKLGLDLGFFDKRVGQQWEDNKSYHNQQAIDPFNVANVYLNYTVRGHSRFAGTKVRLTINNLADSHDETSAKLGGKAITQTFTSNGLTYTDPFQATTATSAGYAQGVNLADTPTLMPGRSVMMSITFGLAKRER